MRVAVVGLGLIGGSMARGLSAAGHYVIGVDRPEVLAKAARVKAIAARAHSAAAAASRCDVVVLAAPPGVNLRLLRALAALRPAALVTDVGSVKRPICAEARRLGFEGFVGGHPMAGTAESGFGASDAALFRGRPWALTPIASKHPPRVLLGLIRDLGAKAVVIGAAEHDRAVAFLSHVPQIVAWGLADAARADATARQYLSLAGPAYRDMTRIARSPPGLWRQILVANGGEIRRALAAVRRAMSRRFRS